MTSSSQIPTASRVQLDKGPAEYLVVVDDGDAYTKRADHFGEGRTPERVVRYVERVADHPEERDAQWDELHGACVHDGDLLTLLTFTAVSHGHAAHLARREFAMASAAARMAEVIDGHTERGSYGWVVIRLDGSSDGELYEHAQDAEDAHSQPELYTLIPVSPLCPWSVRMCDDYLRFWNDVRSGRYAREFHASY
jgi:class 3 adenylate cyclase